jgi:hypothetical protein
MKNILITLLKLIQLLGVLSFILFWDKLITPFQSLSKIITQRDKHNDRQAYTTVVTIYFPLKTSKHSEDKYLTWNKRMLESVDSPLVVFTAPNCQSFINQIRVNKTTKIYLYNDVWDLMSELELKRNKKYVDIYKNKQHEKDEEKGIHNPNLYAIWNLKPYILSKAATSNSFNSEFFIYSGYIFCCFLF